MADKVLAQFGEKQVVECEFAFKCPVRWDLMRQTGDEKMRFCESCWRYVYFAESQSEFEELKYKSECVAVLSVKPIPNSPLMPPVPLAGMPAGPPGLESIWTQENEENSKKSWLGSLFRFFSPR